MFRRDASLSQKRENANSNGNLPSKILFRLPQQEKKNKNEEKRDFMQFLPLTPYYLYLLDSGVNAENWSVVPTSQVCSDAHKE